MDWGTDPRSDIQGDFELFPPQCSVIYMWQGIYARKIILVNGSFFL